MEESNLESLNLTEFQAKLLSTAIYTRQTASAEEQEVIKMIFAVHGKEVPEDVRLSLDGNKLIIKK